MLGEGTNAESMLVPSVDPLDTPFDIPPLDVIRFSEVLILLPVPPVLSPMGLAMPFSSNGGCKVRTNQIVINWG